MLPGNKFWGFLSENVTLLLEPERGVGGFNRPQQLRYCHITILHVLAFSSFYELEAVIATSPLSLNMRGKDNIDHFDAVLRV